MAERLSFPVPSSSAARGVIPVIPGVFLRPAKTSDLAFLQRLYRRTRERELAGSGWSEDDKRAFCRAQFTAQHLDYTRRYPLAWFLIVAEGREPIGRLYVDLSGATLDLIDIALLPQRQGQGIGNRILAALEQRSRETGATLALSVVRDNTRARALYLRRGFEIVEHGATHDAMEWHPTATAAAEIIEQAANPR